MAIATLPALIDKQDTFEIVRDQIAGILKANATAQEALATAAGNDPELHTFRVFTERANPFDEWVDAPSSPRRPIVNVLYDQQNYDKSGSDILERQKSTATYHIDCYGYAVSQADGAGHIPGDKAAALAAQRCVRLVRNILMAAENTYLQLRGTVWQRWPQSVSMFQPAIDGRHVQNVVAARLAFDVTFNESAPQVPTETLEELAIDLIRAETGEIYLEADYDYTV